MIPGAQPTVYYVNSADGWQAIDGAVIEERTVCLYVNGQELASFLCSPVDLDALALGFLRTEGVIGGLGDVALLERAHQDACVDVWLHGEFRQPGRRIRTSGCGNGVTFDDLSQRAFHIPLGKTVTAQQVIGRYLELRAAETLYPITRGVHASALCTPDSLRFIAEDVGRHNTVDKLWGKAMLAGAETAGSLLVTTGRISSEMLGKAAKMQIPLVISRTSPTSRTVELARAWNITIVGYVRPTSMRVYTIPERVRS
ncbi:MAG: formate dehydrogenase accessory sulfurtransferase FdhD [Chloroflexi bacterium]|nr:formate dehydrogenase accessory sulfurtransferase FdhD [Chloroflexota bacterium]